MKHPSPSRKGTALKVTVTTLVVALMLAACSKGDEEKQSLSYEHIQRICLTQPDSALHMLDRAERQGDVSALDANALRSVIYNNALQDYPRAAEYALKALDDPDISRDPDKKARLQSMAAAELCSMGDFNRTLDMCSRALDFAEQTGNMQLAGEVLLTLGETYTEVSDEDRALRAYQRSVELFVRQARKDPTWSNWSNVVTAMAQLSGSHLDNRRYTELMQMESNYRAAIQRMASYSQDMASGDDYAWAGFYAVYATAYAQAGQKEQARKAFDELRKCAVVVRGEGANYLTPYHIAMGEWREALTSATTEEREWLEAGRDTIDSYFARTLLANKASALAGLGQWREATMTSRRVIALADSVDCRDKGLHAMWMSEQLGNTSLIMHVDRQNQQLLIAHIAIAVISVLVIALLVLVVFVVRYNRAIRRKNLAAARLIGELRAYRDRLYAQPATPPTDDEEAYTQLLRQMRDRQLYTQPQLSRKDVAEQLGMTRARLDHLLSLRPDDDFTTIVNEMRLEHAAGLLLSHPQYTVECVARESGLPVRQTFYRLFVRRYGITPSEYRASALQNGDKA